MQQSMNEAEEKVWLMAYCNCLRAAGPARRLDPKRVAQQAVSDYREACAANRRLALPGYGRPYGRGQRL